MARGSGRRAWRVQKAEQRLGTASGESEVEAEKSRRLIRETAEQANKLHYGQAFGVDPLFTIHEDGTVTSNVDGKRITSPNQTLAENFYWRAVHDPFPGLEHDEASEAFYTPDGRLALSRNFAKVSMLMGAIRGRG